MLHLANCDRCGLISLENLARGLFTAKLYIIDIDSRVTNSRNVGFVAGCRFGIQLAFNLCTVANKPMLTFFAIVNMVRFIVK